MLDKGDSQTSLIKVFLVTCADQTEDIVSYIKEVAARDAKKEILLGMDCEGLNISKPLSLMQVGNTGFMVTL